MKVSTLFLLLVLVACKPGIPKDALAGTWVTDKNDSVYRNSAQFEKLVFLANDSFKVEIFMDGNLRESFSGHYVFNEKEKRLTTKVGAVVAQSQIVELTKESLSIAFESTKSVSRYKRQ